MTIENKRFQEVIDLIKHNAPEGCLGRGASEERIQICESKIGRKLPESFVWFLSQFGFVEWPIKVYGIIADYNLGKCEDIVWLTESTRTNFLPYTPDPLIPFYEDGFGNYHCLDTSTNVGKNGKIVFWNHELDGDQEPMIIHNDFLEWLEDSLTRRLDQAKSG